MLLTLGLVVMVIFLFLRNVPATIIPSLALPFSIVGTFAVMYLCNYSLDNLSMMALILSIGFVVDDAIVMLENIVRHMEQGESPMQAALNGSREIGFTIISMTLSLAAVFIPLVFMGGMLGRLFREFAITICVAILISGLVSVTLDAHAVQPLPEAARSHPQARTAVYRFTEGSSTGMLRVYRANPAVQLRHRPVTMALSFAILIATGWLFVKIPKGFLPSEDTNQILVITEGVQGDSHLNIQRYIRAIAEVAREDPNVESSWPASPERAARLSLGGPNYRSHVAAPDSAQASHLERGQMIDVLRPKLNQFPGMRAYPRRIRPAIRIGGQLTKSLYQYTLQGADTQELYTAAQQF